MVRFLAVAALLATASMLAACVQPPPLVIQSATGSVVPLEAWSATLAGMGEVGEVHGTAMVTPGRTIRETQAHVSLSGASPNAIHPWFLQLGECGNDRGVLGGLMAYPPITVDANGEGRATVTLPFTMPVTGRYFVSVRRSEALVSAVIACGNLTKVSDSVARIAGVAHAPPPAP